MCRKWNGIAVIALLLGAALVLTACQQATPAPTPTPCPECPECPECPTPIACPYEEEWAASGHADASAEAFTHWNEETPAEIPVACAACHSTPGYLDFLGADGSAAGTVDKAAPIGTVVTCVACHNPATAALDSVSFPSGATISGLGDEARCMVCHQGRAGGATVDQAIAKVGLADMDTVSADLSFVNIHYYAAAATLYGSQAAGGYQYEGKRYDVRFDHVEGYRTCVDCHNPHTLELKVEECAHCHQGVAKAEDLRAIRMEGSERDYDGDGDTKEGIFAEIQGLQELLYPAIQAYASKVAGTAIVYNPARYPYFFADANANGAVDEGEGPYKSWTGRLLRAAYNYQVSMKDPGAYAHNGKYIIQLLYDAVEDLNAALDTPVDLSKAHREDAGHFAASTEAWRHWDADGRVPGACTRCHTAGGVPQFLAEGTNISAQPSSSMACTTCHNPAQWPARYEVKEVKFPSGATAAFEEADSNLCLLCHQGRAARATVDRATGDATPDQVVEGLTFINIHYAPSGVTLFGTEVQGAYEYAGQKYVGRNEHVKGFTTCTDCHGAHGLEVKEEACKGCHTGIAALTDIRMDKTDYDGDGDTAEGIAGEVTTMRDALLVAIQAYAKDKVGTPIVYNPHRFPYFFVDANGNGVADPEEGDRYATWTPRLLRAAYNYQYASKETGAFAHNPKYVIQVLYDSLKDLGAAQGMTRP